MMFQSTFNRVFEAHISVVEIAYVPKRFLCCFCGVKEYKVVGSISVRVTEGDFPGTVHNAVREQLLTCKFIRSDTKFRFQTYSERGQNIVNNHGYSMRFVTDGHQLFIKGMWAYGKLEPCTNMRVEVEYV
jgi:hypothetical protein